jgi:lipopolysaccharide export LptBFGC system permease protein LptF
VFVAYFLKRFSLRFFLVLIALVPLFVSGDLVVRLAAATFSFQILKLLGFMLPLVCVFAIPIATSLAVGLTVGTVFSQGESIFFKFFPAGRHAVEKSVLIFSIILFICYVPFVFWWAPESYWSGKRFLINAAQQQIENLPAQQFHSIASRCTIFFKNNFRNKEGAAEFRGVLLMVREKDDKRYLVTARSGIMKRNMENEGFLHLKDGVIYNNNIRRNTDCIATFKLLEIAFEKLFFKNGGHKKNKQVKFLTWDELHIDSILTLREIHKRVAQILALTWPTIY